MWCLEISFKRERERDVKTKPLFIYQWLNGWPIHLLRALNLLLVSPIPPRGWLLFALKLTFFPGKAWETTERFWIVRKSQTILFTSLAPSLFLCCCFLLLFVWGWWWWCSSIDFLTKVYPLCIFSERPWKWKFWSFLELIRTCTQYGLDSIF